MLIMPYDTESQSRNVLASPLGEEGHEVAKGWTVVILIMILDVDVTAEGGIIKLIARRAIPPPFEPYEPSEPFEPGPQSGPIAIPQPSGPKALSNLRTLRPIGPVNPKNLSLHNPSTQPAADRRPQPSARRAVNLPL